MYGVFKFEYVVEMLKKNNFLKNLNLNLKLVLLNFNYVFFLNSIKKNKKHNKGCFRFVEIFLNVIFAHTSRGVA